MQNRPDISEMGSVAVTRDRAQGEGTRAIRVGLERLAGSNPNRPIVIVGSQRVCA